MFSSPPSHSLSASRIAALGAEDAAREVAGEAVVPRGHRRVRGEDAVPRHGLRVGHAGLERRAAREAALQQVRAQERRVPLVDVVLRPLVGAHPHRLEQRRAAHAQHHLLAEAVAAVAAVERVGERPVVRVVLVEVRVEQEHRHHVASDALHLVAPRAHAHVAPLDLHRDLVRHRREALLGAPRGRALLLHAALAEPLREVALAVGEGDGHHRQPQVGRRADGVTREHAEAAAVGGETLLEADLHGEVRDGRQRGRRDGHDGNLERERRQIMRTARRSGGPGANERARRACDARPDRPAES
jgi:hypothetical protein